MKDFTIAVLLLAAFWAAGCSTTIEAQRGSSGVPETERLRAAGSSAREVSIAPDLLYDLIIGELAAQRGRLDLAVDTYLDAARSSQSASIAERATRMALFAGRKDQGREALRLWVEARPNDVEPRQISATLLLVEGHTERAVAELKQIVVRADSPEEGFRHVVALLGKVEDRAQGLEAMELLAREFPEDAQAYFALGLMALHAEQLEVADTAVREALVRAPAWNKALTLRARILRRQDRGDEALEVMRQLVQSRSQDLDTRLTFARMLVEARRYAEGREQFRLIMTQQPQDSEVLYALALLSLQTEDLDDAEDVLRELIRRGYHDQEAAYFLGQIAEEREQPEDAIDWYANVKQGDYYLPARIRSVVLQARSGELQAARSQLQRLRVQHEGLDVRLYLVEGEILRDADRLKEAMALYDRALEEIPNNTELLYARGLLGERMDRVDLLERDLSAILQHEPDHADALNALGYTLADRTSRYSEAYAYIQRALELKPDNAAIIDSMGWVHYRLGNYSEAERYLRRALEVHHDAEIAAHLSEVLVTVGKRDQAREVLRNALEQDPGNALLLRLWEQTQ